MRAKRYYELLNTYKAIIDKKEYNPQYSEEEKLPELKEQILLAIDHMRTELDVEMVYRERNMPKNYGVAKLQHKDRRLYALSCKIFNNAPITEEDYINTHVDDNILKRYIPIIILIILVIMIKRFL